MSQLIFDCFTERIILLKIGDSFRIVTLGQRPDCGTHRRGRWIVSDLFIYKLT